MLNFALCDDNESILARLSKMLESLFIKYNFDCKVTFTSVDPNSFLAYVINNPVDVIFLDIDGVINPNRKKTTYHFDYSLPNTLAKKLNHPKIANLNVYLVNQSILVFQKKVSII